VVVVVNCVGPKKCLQGFQRLNFVQAVNITVLAKLWFKDSDFLNVSDMAEHLRK